MFTKLILSLTIGVFLLSTGDAQDDLAGIKCIVNGKKTATLDASVEYKDGRVYFCCNHCAEIFKEDLKRQENAKYAVKANHQLVLTGQYVQRNCPLTGGEVNQRAAIQIGGMKIGFCCEGCSSRIKGMENLAAKANLVFSNRAFEKAFRVRKVESAVRTKRLK